MDRAERDPVFASTFDANVGGHTEDKCLPDAFTREPQQGLSP